jgi:protein SCO1/2
MEEHEAVLGGRRRALAAVLAGMAWPTFAHDGPHAPVRRGSVRRQEVALRTPDVELLRDDGRPVRLVEQVALAPRVAVNFVYLGCTTVCPLSSQLFAEVQQRSGAAPGELQLLSISIDPQRDRPAQLADHARRFRRTAGWGFYTGTVDASEAVQRAFGVWRPDRMDHPPATFVRAGAEAGWVRLDGFPSPEAVIAELRRPAGRGQIPSATLPSPKT